MRDWRAFGARVGVVAIATWLAITAASGQEWWDSSRDGIPDVSIATSLPHNGDPGGYRKWLSQRGIVYGLEYTNDVLSNVRGGLRTGTIDQGKLQGILTVDFGRLTGWHGLVLMVASPAESGRARPTTGAPAGPGAPG